MAKIALRRILAGPNLFPPSQVNYHGSVVIGNLLNVTPTRPSLGQAAPPDRPYRGRAARPANATGSQREISLLFDVFVLNQRLRSLLTLALSGTGLRPDEYAVYSLLFDAGPQTPTEMSRQMAMPLTTVLDYVRAMRERGHVTRRRHATDGRAFEARLTASGLRAFHTANGSWNQALRHFEPALAMPVDEIRRALHAMDDAAELSLRQVIQESIGRAG